jgi:hypothetical protein
MELLHFMLGSLTLIPSPSPLEFPLGRHLARYILLLPNQATTMGTIGLQNTPLAINTFMQLLLLPSAVSARLGW